MCSGRLKTEMHKAGVLVIRMEKLDSILTTTWSCYRGSSGYDLLWILQLVNWQREVRTYTTFAKIYLNNSMILFNISVCIYVLGLGKLTLVALRYNWPVIAVERSLTDRQFLNVLSHDVRMQSSLSSVLRALS